MTTDTGSTDLALVDGQFHGDEQLHQYCGLPAELARLLAVQAISWRLLIEYEEDRTRPPSFVTMDQLRVFLTPPANEKTKPIRTDWSNVVVDEGDEAP